MNDLSFITKRGNLKSTSLTRLEESISCNDSLLEGRIVSKDINGEALSYYCDDMWDFKAYRQAGDVGSACIYFNFAGPSIISEAKWLLYLIIFVAESKTNYGLSIATIMTMMKAIKKLSKYAEKSSKSIKSILNSKSEIDIFVKQQKHEYIIKIFSSVLSYLASIDQEISGYELKEYYSNFETPLLSKRANDKQQFAVIPPRILAELIDQIDTFIRQVYSNLNNLLKFLGQVVSDKGFAASERTQKKLDISSLEPKPFFKDAVKMHGLDELFEEHNLVSLVNVGSYLTRIQHACRVKIHIYTGMRFAEVSSLKIDSLVEKNYGGKMSYQFVGETSKLAGQKKVVSWVTSKDVCRAFNVANKLAKFILSVIDINEKDCPLFISHSYLGIYGLPRPAIKPFSNAVLSSNLQEVFSSLDQEKFIINESDFKHLNKVDPFRAWQDEENYQVGQVWRFTSHQYRRSLAFYASQSANVSLGALKSQLKHITKEMSIYYCNASSLAHEYDHNGHFSHLTKAIKPESDAVAYSSLIYDDSEPLEGPFGCFIEKRIKPNKSKDILFEDRAEIIKQFKKGELKYAETPLGACMSTKPCDKKLFRIISACINCPHAVIKIKKLKQVIIKQELFIKELEAKSSDSIAYRTELSELDNLKGYYRKILNKNTKSGKNE